MDKKEAAIIILRDLTAGFTDPETVEAEHETYYRGKLRRQLTRDLFGGEATSLGSGTLKRFGVVLPLDSIRSSMISVRSLFMEHLRCQSEIYHYQPICRPEVHVSYHEAPGWVRLEIKEIFVEMERGYKR